MILVGTLITALLAAIAMVLIAAHVTKPERVALGLRTKWGLLGLEVVRPRWPAADDPSPPHPVATGEYGRPSSPLGARAGARTHQ